MVEIKMEAPWFFLKTQITALHFALSSVTAAIFFAQIPTLSLAPFWTEVDVGV